MKKKRLYIQWHFLFQLLCYFLITSHVEAQDCTFKDTLFHFHFGTASQPQEFSLSKLKLYRKVNDYCPDDGYYSFVPFTSDCFSGDWINLQEDHTPNDSKGRMMLVNASPIAGTFFTVLLNGFKPGKAYEFSTWLINVCKLNGSCPPLPPRIEVTLSTVKGKKVASFLTGEIAQSAKPVWRRYFGLFTNSTDEGSLILTLANMTNGGCGNDFAIDDIIFRECYPEEDAPAVTKNVVPEIPAPKPKAAVALEKVPAKELKRKKVNPVAEEAPLPAPTAGGHLITMPVAQAQVPDVLLKRTSELIKTIDADDGKILIELYDNGIIDGDTVTIFHNNKEIVTKAALSSSAIRVYVTVSKDEPIHEIVMVANNSGSIPPNTSLMVVTENKKRYEVFISSSEQKNAKIIIRKKQ